MSDDATPKEADPESATSEEDGEDAPKKKGMGLIPMVVAGLAAAGVAGGAAFVLTPGGGKDDHACIAESHDAGKDHGAESHEENNHGDDDHGEDEDLNAECAPDEEKENKKDDEAHSDKKKKKKKSDKGGHGDAKDGASNIKPLGEVQHSEHATFLVMEPMIVSISPIGRSKHLKVSLVFETTEDGAEVLLENGFYVQDVLNTFLRSVDAQVLEDPTSMSRLRAQILRRIHAITPDADVSNVLITEFILT